MMAATNVKLCVGYKTKPAIVSLLDCPYDNCADFPSDFYKTAFHKGMPKKKVTNKTIAPKINFGQAKRANEKIPPKKSIFIFPFSSDTTQNNANYSTKSKLGLDIRISSFKFNFSYIPSKLSFKLTVLERFFNGILHLIVVLATVCGNFVILNDICNLSMEVLLEIPDKEKLILTPPPMKLNNIQAADDMEIANLFVDIFLSVYVHNNATNANLNRKNRYACNDNINYNLLDTYTVNRNMLLVVDKFKAVFKGVPSCVPSNCAVHLSERLTNLCNFSIIPEYFAFEWKNSIIISLFNNGRQTKTSK
uniref:Uncharacterized protein n=1 Tax=Glossina palpalis gambiensis TaxID=67801 RepID=A0A1B0AS20_9MUSC